MGEKKIILNTINTPDIRIAIGVAMLSIIVLYLFHFCFHIISKSYQNMLLFLMSQSGKESGNGNVLWVICG